jgi:hypothetical protein
MKFRRFAGMKTREVVVIHQILRSQSIRLHIPKSPDQRPKTDVEFAVGKSMAIADIIQ